MPIELTEELVAAMAPVDKAILDGRELIKKGAFRALAKSEDGTLVFADCQGSGSSPYKVSLDLDTGGDRAARDVKLRGSRAGVLADRARACSRFARRRCTRATCSIAASAGTTRAPTQ
jgi:hypothetical protein